MYAIRSYYVRNLTVIKNCIALIEKQGKTPPDLLHLDYSDQRTFELLQNSDRITSYNVCYTKLLRNFEQIAQKIGIAPVVIKSGEYKDMGSPMRELKDSEKQLFQNLVDELHAQFVSDAAAARDMETDVIAKLADGRVYTGQTAMKLKLVDRIGNMDDAVQWAGQMAGIEEELTPVYPKEDKMTLFRKLAETLFQDVNLGSRLSEQFRYAFN